MKRRGVEHFDTPRSQVDRDIKRLQLDMELANLRLEQAAAAGPEAMARAERDVIDELDALWPYHGHEFLVIGKWRTAELVDPTDEPSESKDPEEEGDTEEDEGGVAVAGPAAPPQLRFAVDFSVKEVMERALSHGFAVDRVLTPPRVGYFFSRPGQLRLALNPYLFMEGSRNALALPEDVTLSHLGDVEDIQQTEDRWQDILRAIEQSERLHELYVSQPNFYQASPRRQAKVMEGLIADINTELATLYPLTINASTEVAYVNLEQGRDKYDTVISPKKRIEIQGRLASVGLFNMETVEAGRLKSPQDLVNKHGIFLNIVDLQPPTPDAIVQRQVARVSFRAVQGETLRLLSDAE